MSFRSFSIEDMQSYVAIFLLEQKQTALSHSCCIQHQKLTRSSATRSAFMNGLTVSPETCNNALSGTNRSTPPRRLLFSFPDGFSTLSLLSEKPWIGQRKLATTHFQLILRRPFDFIEHYYVHRLFPRFESQAQLLSNSSEECRTRMLGSPRSGGREILWLPA